jgi:hypothetical protein
MNLYLLKLLYFTVYETLWRLVMVKYIWNLILLECFWRFLIMDLIVKNVKDIIKLSLNLGYWGIQLKLNELLGYVFDE